MNPHQKETSFVYDVEEKEYVDHEWQDTGVWVDVGGFGLIICTVSISTGYSCNAGFRIVDENNEVLLPYRTSTNTRVPAHFSMEPNHSGNEDLTPVAFHMIANCKYAKLQIHPADSSGGNPGRVRINAAPTVNPSHDTIWNHKAISTMTVLPLLPNYQGGANTIFTYPHSRMLKIGKEGSKDKKSSNLLKNNRPNSNN